MTKQTQYPKGVNKTDEGRYRSRITHKGKHICLGTFETEREAHEAYVAFRTKHPRDYSKTLENLKVKERPESHKSPNFFRKINADLIGSPWQGL